LLNIVVLVTVTDVEYVLLFVVLPEFVDDTDGLLLFVVEAVPVTVTFGVRVPVPDCETDPDRDCCADNEATMVPLSV
jgi:hypothetical protein